MQISSICTADAVMNALSLSLQLAACIIKSMSLQQELLVANDSPCMPTTPHALQQLLRGTECQIEKLSYTVWAHPLPYSAVAPHHVLSAA